MKKYSRTSIENFIKMPLSEKLDKANRVIEIINEVRDLKEPKLGPYSVEDVDDLYQEKLEFNWHVSDLIDELDSLNNDLLGIPDGYPYDGLLPEVVSPDSVLKYKVIKESGDFNMITEVNKVINAGNISLSEYKWIIQNYAVIA